MSVMMLLSGRLRANDRSNQMPSNSHRPTCQTKSPRLRRTSASFRSLLLKLSGNPVELPGDQGCWTRACGLGARIGIWWRTSVLESTSFMLAF